MQLVVLGMHRSGTSSVTRLLNLAGAWFGPDGIATAANDENPRGFWERRDVRAVCDGLLHSGGFDWWRVADLDLASIPPADRERHLSALGAIVAELDEHRPWVVKEPRLCLLMPLVLPLLDAPVVVHVTREPLEVAESLQARSGFSRPAALALWELYLGRALTDTAGLPAVHVRYEDVIADPVGTTTDLVARLTALGVAGLHVPDPDEVLAFITPELHRRRAATGRDVQLNARQAELAEAIDAAALLDLPLPWALSAGAHDELRALAEAEDLRADVARLEAEPRLAQRRVEVLERRLADTDRAHQELRRHASRPLWVLAGGRAKATASRTSRRLRAVVHDPPAPDDGRALTAARVALRAAAGRVARARSATTRGTPPPSAPGPAPVVRVAARPTPGADDETASRPAEGGSAVGARRPSVAVLVWDVGHNPLGRAIVLAEVLARRFDVEIWGAQFARYGSEVWPPLREASVPINIVEGRAFPSHLETMEHLATQITADALVVSKPRLPSLLLGVLAKHGRNRPLILDVDDHELAFFGEDVGLDRRQLLARAGEPDLVWPFERTWTRACEPVITAADAVTVSSPALQRRYGGTVVPHARDERTFDPAHHDREEVRARLGVTPDQRLLLFGGTPRAHKGVGRIIEALEELDDDRYRLMVFGSRQLDEMRRTLGPGARWLLALPEIPFADLPAHVVAADLACVLQDPDHPVAAYQMPAKITDALAMGVPCLVTATPPLAPLVEAGVVQVVEPDASLAERLRSVFDDPAPVRAAAERGRALFLAEMSHAAVADRLGPLVEDLMADPPPLHADLAGLAATVREVWAPAVRPAPLPPERSRPARSSRLRPGEPFDLVVFWKQNDTGLYGRRQDMIVKYLRRSGRVRTVVHFDDPTSPEELARLALRGVGVDTDQSSLVVRQTLARLAHRRDEPGLRQRTLLHGGSLTGHLGLPDRAAQADHVARTLRRAGVGVGDVPLVAWCYPPNLDLAPVLDRIAPDLVVADVVDDARSWTRPGSAMFHRIEASYAELLGRSDLVLANCAPAAETVRDLASPIAVVPNGCELPDELPDGPPPPALAALDGPILGYVGNLSSRLDIDLIEAVARARPRWQIVLVGSTHLDPTILRLDAMTNVHFLGVLPYEEALRVVRHLDVGLIPHLDNDMTRVMNPLKAFVYAAAGVPIVSTPVANLGELGHHVTVASGRDGFVAAIEAALARGRQVPDGIDLVPHSWPTRVAEVLRLIDETAAPPDRSPVDGRDVPGTSRPGRDVPGTLRP